MTEVVLEIPGTPPSYNRTAHAHWTVNRAVKRTWQENCELVLMEARVPRGLHLVEVRAKMFFKQVRRRDEGNFRVVIEKSLGDALTNGGWLPDDTPDHYRFYAVELLAPSSTPRTELTLTL